MNVRNVLKAVAVFTAGTLMMLSFGVDSLAENENTQLNFDNLAKNKVVTCSGEQSEEGNYALNIVDGNEATRWSAPDYGNYVCVDLGQKYYLSNSKIIPRAGKQYDYEISISSNKENFETVVTGMGRTESTYSDDLGNVCGRYVKLTITGGDNGDNHWVSILEFEIYGTMAEINWALTGNVSQFSSEQVDGSNSNYAKNMIDGNSSTRWSVEGYPNYAVVDLGAPKSITRIEVEPIEKRPYQYTIEASLDGAHYTKIADRADNMTSAEFYSDDIEPVVSARFIKITVTGSANNNAWISISELRVFGLCNNTAKPIQNVNIERTDSTIHVTGTSSALCGGTVTLVVVVFDGDKMIAIEKANIELTEYGNSVDISVEVPLDDEGRTVEAFIWDNDEHMMSCSDTFSL